MSFDLPADDFSGDRLSSTAQETEREREEMD